MPSDGPVFVKKSLTARTGSRCSPGGGVGDGDGGPPDPGFTDVLPAPEVFEAGVSVGLFDAGDGNGEGEGSGVAVAVRGEGLGEGLIPGEGDGAGDGDGEGVGRPAA